MQLDLQMEVAQPKHIFLSFFIWPQVRDFNRLVAWPHLKESIMCSLLNMKEELWAQTLEHAALMVVIDDVPRRYYCPIKKVCPGMCS